MHIKEAQAEPETADPIHHAAAHVAGEEVQGKAVPEHRGACRVLQQPQPDRDPGQDLVPEQEGKVKEATGGRDREDQDGS